MKMVSNKFYSSVDQAEYVFTKSSMGVFLSMHHSEGKVCGIYLHESDVNETNLNNFKQQAKLFLGNEFNKCELKLIGQQSQLIACTKVLPDNLFNYVKRIIRENELDVIFTPSQGRVRISKEVIGEVKKDKIKVLIVDDSKTIRNILAKIFATDPQFEVIGSLELPSQVEPFIEKNRPDVITLDIHMPEMDGVSLLKKIYPKYKIPCVMISSISLAEGPMVFDALENGAVDYIQKPEAKDIQALTPTIVEKIKMASNVKAHKKVERSSASKVKATSAKDSLVVIGSSTGGTEALRTILTMLPDEIPPILIVQHIPAVFSLAFAKRMNDLCTFEVMEAKNGDEVKPNRVLVAPGGTQMKMIHKNGKTIVEINDDAPVNRFKPSVDYMFKSVVDNFFCHTVAVILTGMGKDGAKEMMSLKNKGAITIAQNEESCVVFGMPREAIAIGAALHVEDLSNIAERIILSTNQGQLKKVSSL